MGKYINETSTGKTLGPSFNEKIKALVEDGAEEVHPTEFRDNLICIMDNGPFAAAGYADTEAEFKYFKSSGDHRPKRWFVYEHAVAVAK
jgi:hypothetical protein